MAMAGSVFSEALLKFVIRGLHEDMNRTILFVEVRKCKIFGTSF
ncbi:hypothetical protein OROGR_012559 [Orobanche gracilis]